MTKISFDTYGKFFKTLSNKTRFDITMLLMKGQKSVNEISKELKFEQSRVSHNLKRLECYGFLSSKCKGKQRIYYLDKKYILPIMKKIDNHINKYEKRVKERLKSKKLQGGNN